MSLQFGTRTNQIYEDLNQVTIPIIVFTFIIGYINEKIMGIFIIK